jgi:folate-binding protein YgfZ
MSDPPQRPIAVVPPPAAAATPADAPQVAEGHRRLTTDVGLLDRSASGKLALTGEDAASFLTGQVTADVEGLAPGEGSYAALLTPKGKIVCDLRVLAIGEGAAPEELLLLCERSGLQALFDHLRRHLIGFRAELHKRTLQQGLVSVAGPRTGEVLGDLLTGLGEREHDHRATALDGVRVRVVRTDVGVDVVATAEDVPRVLAALEARGIAPVPAAAFEVLRVESGRPLLGHELDDSVMPAEAGIVERAVSFTKGCYIGQETVARLHWRGRPNRHLRGLLLEDAVPEATVLVDDGREVGRVTTVVHSPRRGPIALGLLRREIEPGDVVTARPTSASPVRARVVALPFADEPRGPVVG